MVEEDALIRMVRPMITEAGIYAEGATIRLLNGCEYAHGKVTKVQLSNNYWEIIQIGEYLRAFLYGRLGWNLLGGTLSISGAFGLFDKERVMWVGGYDRHSIGEDMELTLAMIEEQKKRFKTAATRFIPDPVAWTEGPSSAYSLGKQRIRWHQGLLECIANHWTMFLNPRYGWSGILGMPSLILAEALQPIMEFWGYFVVIAGLCVGVLDGYYVMLFILVTWGLNTLLTIVSIMMELVSFQRFSRARDIAKLILFAFLENLGYRQMYFIWKIRGMINYFRKKQIWIVMK